MSSLRDAIASGPVVIDGGLATHLEARGHDLSSHLWSARMVVDEPDEVVAAHHDFFVAGAQVATTASYQASFEGLGRLGLDRAAAVAVLTATVHLADRARRQFADVAGHDRTTEDALGDASSPGGRSRWVAASVGPYGAALADGSEYRGDYGLSVAELARWHRPRLEVLADAGADVLALETIPCLAEVEALLALVDGSGVACWLSLTSDGDRTRRGEPLAEAFAMAADVDEVVAVGVNCCEPTDVATALAIAAEVTDTPLIAYPNSGEEWDAPNHRWVGTPTFEPARVANWVDAGARVVGGCCRVTPTDIAGLAAELSAIGGR